MLIEIESLPSESHLFVYQTRWMKRLLQRCGNDICLLDTTCFFLAVKINFDYKLFSGNLLWRNYSQVLIIDVLPICDLCLSCKHLVKFTLKSCRIWWTRHKKKSLNIACVTFCGKCFQFSLSYFMKMFIQPEMLVLKSYLKSVCKR